MKVRGYVAMSLAGYQIVETLTQEFSKGVLASGARLYTFEIEVPHPLPELKVIEGSTVEVGREKIQVKAGEGLLVS